MARKSVIVRQRKREKMVANAYQKRASFKATIADPNATLEEKFQAVLALQKMPRDTSPTRLRTRCNETGRPRGVWKRFMLSGMPLRRMIMEGLLPGAHKDSW